MEPDFFDEDVDVDADGGAAFDARVLGDSSVTVDVAPQIEVIGSPRDGTDAGAWTGVEW